MSALQPVRLQPVRGTRDLIGEDQRRHAHVIETARHVAALYGFDEWATPIFEDTAVFARSLGETSDVVSKEMYTFSDRGGDSLTLRPENTAGICRALVTNGLAQSLPQRVFYAGPMFRYERPQKGRYRQFHQIGAELIGPAEPLADAEVIGCGWDILVRLGIAAEVTLEVNTLGDHESRNAYRAALVAHFSAHRDALSEDSQARLERNPLRILDSKDPADRALVEMAPTIAAHLTDAASSHYAAVQGYLSRAGVPFRENPRIVRGLDYYNHVAFEFVTTALGAQGTVMGGGRYDGLVAEMGGPPTPAVGWAAGIERLGMLLAAAPAVPTTIAVIPTEEACEAAALAALRGLRAANLRAENRLPRQFEAPDGAGQQGRGPCRRHHWPGRGRAGGGASARPDGRHPGRGGACGAGRAFVVNLADRLDRISARAEELSAMLQSGLGGEAFVRASRELAEIEPVVARAAELRRAERAAAEAAGMLADPDMRELAEAELSELKERIPTLQQALRVSLLPRDAADQRSAIIEIRPAAGGDEAGLFAAELVAMYEKYAAVRGWRWQTLDFDDTGLGGIKNATAEVTGSGVFARLKFESGVHRVQRVPATESQGRIHTSTVTVAVLPEAEEVDVAIDEGDLRIDVYRASGAGGQHVNKTESAVRITHLPTGIAVAMQEEKSQHKNKAKAMKILRARLYEQQRASLHATRAADRRSQVGTGDRSERIRTYNFPQGRVSDHRINMTLYKIERVMGGELDEFIDALIAEDQAEKLAAEE